LGLSSGRQEGEEEGREPKEVFHSREVGWIKRQDGRQGGALGCSLIYQKGID
jgi:hypothetical protein